MSFERYGGLYREGTGCLSMESAAHNYFYVRPDEVEETRFYLSGDEFHHAVKTLRLKEGDTIHAVDGLGNEFLGELEKIAGGARYRCRILRTKWKPREPEADVTLLQAVVKGSRFDYLVEKSVEIGVNRIVPVEASRCVARAGAPKIERWRRIARAAMKQSCRSFLPVVTGAMTWEAAFESLPDSAIRILLHSGSAVTLENILIQNSQEDSPVQFAVAVGPEGDFTSGEIESAAGCGFTPVTLGPRRLRSETAGIAALSVLLAGSRRSGV